MYTVLFTYNLPAFVINLYVWDVHAWKKIRPRVALDWENYSEMGASSKTRRGET